MLDKLKIQKEADAYFLRNKETMESVDCSIGMKIFSEFYDRFDEKIPNAKILEVGSSIGQNLFYMSENYGMECFGVEPSKLAVEYGNKKAQEHKINVILKEGFSDDLDFKDETFDIVYFGFCLYQVDRRLLLKTVEEADRVLKPGGFVVVTDFDTPTNFIRQNIHNADVKTYKADYSKVFIPYGYSLVYKKTYSSEGKDVFVTDVQDRVSTQVFYKEKITDIYLKA